MLVACGDSGLPENDAAFSSGDVNFTAPDPEAALDIAPPPPIEAQDFAPDPRAAGQPRQIGWDDLMPAGEEEKLAEMYEAFYLELDRKLRGSQTQLTAPGSAWSPADMEEGGALDQMPQLGTFDTVAELDGQHVRLPAYITPLDFDARSEHREFLLVPYFGACIHSPPPPPNQVIFVQADPPARISNIWGAVWAEGVLTTQKNENDIGSAAYTLRLTKISPYDGT